MAILKIKAKYSIVLGFILLLALGLFSWFLWDKYSVHNGFLEAENLYNTKEYEKAEEKYLLYLQDSSNKNLRWEAWERLEYISTQLNNNFAKSITYLNMMEEEYKENLQKTAIILKNKVRIYRIQGNQEKILRTIEQLLNNKKHNLLEQEKINYYKQYAAIASEHLASLTEAKKQFTRCIEEESEEIVMLCKYELASAYMLKEEYKSATKLFNYIVENTEKESGINYFSIYMLGNIAVSRGEKKKALEHFKAIKNIYPNKTAIISRIKSLQK